MKTKWTKKWPTKPGLYWFYGWPWGRTKDVSFKPIDPELLSVRIMQVSNGVVYVIKGTFWYKSEGAIGMFCKAELPELPDISGLVPKEKNNDE